MRRGCKEYKGTREISRINDIADMIAVWYASRTSSDNVFKEVFTLGLYAVFPSIHTVCPITRF